MPLHSPTTCAPARVMFYLPVVTPWWFENIVVHLIRVMAREHEVHVLIPPLWRNTGIGEDQLPLINDLKHVFWHLLDGPDHPMLRHDASSETDLTEFVEAIAPDVVLCRSADIKTPARFPGIVRYIMEGAAPPFATAAQWVTLAETLFDYGAMPELSEDELKALQPIAQSLAPTLSATHTRSRADWFAMHDIAPETCIIGLPLEYEHEENFFGQHHPYPSNAAMIEALCSELPANAILAVTNHPLNDLYGDNRAVETAIGASDGQAILLKPTALAGQATLDLSQHCDGMIVGNSKSWAICAALGTPLLRLGGFATGLWANAYTSLELFLDDIARGNAKTCDPGDARFWFANHLANAVFDPADPALDAQDILDRMIRSNNPARWDAALSRIHAQNLGEAA